MSTSIDQPRTCVHCGFQFWTDDPICPSCGIVEATAVRDMVSPRRLIDRKWVVCLLLFGVMGALGLPVLWFSRGFSRPAKIGLSVAVTLYTFVLIGLTTLSCLWAWRELQRLF